MELVLKYRSFYDSLKIIIENFFRFSFLVTSISTSHSSPFVSQKEKESEENLKPKWKNPM